jgi:hypothetical protein
LKKKKKQKMNHFDASLGDDLDESGGDPVVSEHPVFVNAREYDNTMTVVTFPTTPCTRPRPLHTAVRGAWQREQKNFRFELGKVPPNNASRAVAMTTPNDDVTQFKRAFGSRRVPLAANYAVGVVSASGELHLTPCNVAVDLLQDFAHIDERNAADRAVKEQEARDDALELAQLNERDQDGEITLGRGAGGIHSAGSIAVSMNSRANLAEAKAAAAAGSAAGTAAALSTAAATTTTAATTAATNTTTTPSTTDQNAATKSSTTVREHSYEHMLALSKEETWRDLDVSRVLDADALVCSQPHQRRVCEQVAGADEIDWYEQTSRLLPGTRRSDAWTRPGASQQARSQVALSRLSLVQQVAQIMRQEQTLSFSAVAEKASRVVDDGGLLEALSHVAVMVRGRWIAKSNLVCGGNLVLEAARNFILYMFAIASSASSGDADDVNLARNEEAGVSVHDMADQTSLLIERVYGLLEPFAKPRSSRSSVFVLRLDRDRDFLSRHVGVSEMYDAHWSSVREELLLAISQVVRGVSSEVEKNVHFALGVRHDALYALDESTLGGATAIDQLRNFLLGMFEHFGVCSMALLETTLESLKIEQRFAPLVTHHHSWMPELVELLSTEAIELQPHVYCRKEVGDEAIDKHRNVIVQMYREKTDLKRADIMAKLREKGALPIAGATYTSILRELADAKGAKWVLKRGNGVTDA